MLAAMAHCPLVAVAERHWVQEWHDFMTALLYHPNFPHTLTDIVVEFGSSAYQGVVDRFVMGDKTVSNEELAQIWQQLGDPGWQVPCYEQFFRTVRAVNWMRSPEKRIRVLLAQPDITMEQVLAHPKDKSFLNRLLAPVDDNYARVVRTEVMQRKRRALLIAGGGHLMRGVETDPNSHHLNAASQIARRYPNALYVVDTVVLPPGFQQDAAGERLRKAFETWHRASIAALAGTWLGATAEPLDNYWTNQGASRAVDQAAARYSAQADAILYLGPGEVITASRPEPSTYHWGNYQSELRRLGAIMSQDGQPTDLIRAGLDLANAGPNWFSLFG
jgi:hypothetical protein